MITLHEGELEGITMKHYSLSLLLLCFLSAVLLGCQSANSEPLPAGELSKISISISNGFGKVDGDFLAEYEDQETLDLFKHAISHAAKREGIADMAEPEFDVKITFTNGKKQSYHLWVGEKGQQSILMNVKDTNTTYVISEELTDWFIHFLKSKEM